MGTHDGKGGSVCAEAPQGPCGEQREDSAQWPLVLKRQGSCGSDHKLQSRRTFSVCSWGPATGLTRPAHSFKLGIRQPPTVTCVQGSLTYGGSPFPNAPPSCAGSGGVLGRPVPNLISRAHRVHSGSTRTQETCAAVASDMQPVLASEGQCSEWGRLTVVD